MSRCTHNALFSIGIASCLARIASAQDEGFRFFFDTAGVLEDQPRSASDPLLFTNPTVGGSGRLYFYVEYGTANQRFSGINLRLDITGDAVFSSGAFYNHDCAGADRWAPIPNPFVAPNSTSWIIGSALGGGSFYGARNAPFPETVIQVQDTHFRRDDGSAFGTTLLGYCDVTYNGPVNGPPAELRFSSGTSGHAGETITVNDTVYFGFGDGGVTNKANRTSTMADAYILPSCDPCDADCNGSTNPFDIAPFLALLGSTPPTSCSPCAGDTDANGTINPFDITAFLNCLAP